MRKFLNIQHVTFNLLVNGVNELVIGTLIHIDETGGAVQLDSDGSIHAYGLDCFQHATILS